MRVVARFSFNKGREVIEAHHATALSEVIRVINSVRAEDYITKESKEPRRKKAMIYAPRELNKAFKEQFAKVEGWKPVRVQSKYTTEHYESDFKPTTKTRGSFREMDFVKNRVGVEIQFGKYSFMVYNVAAKMTIFHNLNHIDVGIEVVPVKDMVVRMSSGVSYFEQFVWDLTQRGVADIDIPVLILGITADAVPAKVEPEIAKLL